MVERPTAIALLALVGLVVMLYSCGPLFPTWGDNFFLVYFKNATPVTLSLYDSPGRQDYRQDAAPGATVTRSYSGRSQAPRLVELWEGTTLYYCAHFTPDDFKRLDYTVVITGPRADC